MITALQILSSFSLFSFFPISYDEKGMKKESQKTYGMLQTDDRRPKKKRRQNKFDEDEKEMCSSRSPNF